MPLSRGVIVPIPRWWRTSRDSSEGRRRLQRHSLWFPFSGTSSARKNGQCDAENEGVGGDGAGQQRFAEQEDSEDGVMTGTESCTTPAREVVSPGSAAYQMA